MGLLESATSQRVTIKRWAATGLDDRGNQTGTYTDTANVPAHLQERAESEITAGEQAVVGEWECHFRADAVIAETDRVVFGSRTFEVVTVVDQYDWFGRLAFRTAQLREVA